MRMKRLIAVLIAGLPGLGLSPVYADEAASPHSFTGGVALSTDYMYRGQSQTGNNPAVSGTVNYAYDGAAFDVYAGTWASSINFGGNVEIDWYGGLTGSIGDTGLNWDVGFLYYQYPGGDDLDFIEGHIGLSYAFSDLAFEPTLGVKAHWSPDWQLDADGSGYYEGNLALKLPYDFGLSFHVAHQEVSDNATWGSPDWTEWNVYLSKAIYGPISAAVGYHDTDLSKAECFGGTNICEGRAVFVLSAAF
jgi:uncharacterized protein (TIGR02001 family)